LTPLRYVKTKIPAYGINFSLKVKNTMNDLEVVSKNNEQIQSSDTMDIAVSRAAQEVQAAMVIAKKFPRNEIRAFTAITEACKRPSLAEQAIYSYPRGGTTVEGPSIRLAEEMARNWGNLDFGIIELSQANGESSVMAYAWDLQTNTRQTKIFTVPHVRISGSGANQQRKPLTDPRDIYEMVANQGARRVRACILGVIPGDICDAAVEQCNQTMRGGGGVPLIDRARKMVAKFDDFGVTQVMIEKRIGHRLDACTETEVINLGKIYKSIADGHASRESFFEFGEKTERPAPPQKPATGAAAAVETPIPQKTVEVTKPETVSQQATAPVVETGAEQQNGEPAAEQSAASTEKKRTRAAKPTPTPAPEPELTMDPPDVPADPVVEPKTALGDKEEFKGKVIVTAVSTLLISKMPSVKATVTGAFEGTVYHRGGAKVDPSDPAKLIPLSAWQTEKPVNVDLIGTGQADKSVVNFVRFVEIAK
jgi:hypothetical protein